MKTEEQQLSATPVEGIDSEGKDAIESTIHAVELNWAKRKKITKIVLIISVIVAGISLMIPNAYVATVTILPDLSFLTGMGSTLGGFKDLAAAVGLNPNQTLTSPSQLYPDVMQSEFVLRRVIYHKYKTEKYDSLVNLIQYWGYDKPDENRNFEKCLSKLRKSVMTVSVDKKTLIISLEILASEPQFAADIANEVASELDYFQRNFRQTNAGEQRKFLEQRVGEVKDDLAKAEERLKEFQEKNRRTEQSPQLQLEQGRLSRDVDLNSTLFIELKRQFELAKLDEIKNTPVVQVLDVARPPADHASPRRTIMVLVAFFLSFLGASTWFVIADRLRENEKALEQLGRVSRLLRTIRTDLGRLIHFKRRHEKDSIE